MNARRTVAIVMSRHPRLIVADAHWLAGLRACLRHIRARQRCLLWSPGTAGAEFVSRGAERLGIEIRQLTMPADGSPPDQANNSASSSSVSSSFKDQLLVEQADEIYVLNIRKDGNIQRLISARLSAGRRNVCLVNLPELQPALIRQQWIEAGADEWTPSETSLMPFPGVDDESNPTSKPRDAGGVVCLISATLFEKQGYLTHTTRACPGPWPRQPESDYLDALFERRHDADHSACQTLRRIVRQRLLIGSGRTIRGQFPVVSFTSVPLAELPDLRCFRPHRTHWDFEPFGICIRQDALITREVRPVIYGDERTWTDLAETDRPFYQRSDRSPESLSTSVMPDWSIEREWRHQGDLDLASFDPQQVCVFVPTYADAKLLQPDCPWPITLWPGELAARRP